MQKSNFLRFLRGGFLKGIAVLLLLLCWGCNFDTTSTLARSNDEPAMVRFNPRSFTLNTQGKQPVLQLHGDVCQVRVQSGNGSRVVVRVTVRHYQGNPMPTIRYNMDSNSNMLSIDEKLPQTTTNVENDSVIFDITVPRNIDLPLSNNVGSFEISGVSGKLAVATSTGSITVANVHLTRHSSLITNVGSITFAGSFAPQGVYRMISNVGSIDLAFQGSPSLQVDAQASLGSISSAFPSLNVSRNVAQGTLGNGPASQLLLRTQVGSISLR